MAGDQRPGIAIVPARIHLTKPGAEIDPGRVSASRRPSRREAPLRSRDRQAVPSSTAPMSRRRSRSGTRAAWPPEETVRHQPGAETSRAYRVDVDGQPSQSRSCSAGRIRSASRNRRGPHCDRRRNGSERRGAAAGQGGMPPCGRTARTRENADPQGGTPPGFLDWPGASWRHRRGSGRRPRPTSPPEGRQGRSDAGGRCEGRHRHRRGPSLAGAGGSTSPRPAKSSARRSSDRKSACGSTPA